MKREEVIDYVIEDLTTAQKKASEIAGSEIAKRYAKRLLSQIENLERLKARSTSVSKIIEDGSIVKTNEGKIFLVADIKIPNIVGLDKLRIQIISLQSCRDKKIKKVGDSFYEYTGQPNEGEKVKVTIAAIF